MNTRNTAALWCMVALAALAASTVTAWVAPSTAQRTTDVPPLEELLSAARRSEQAGDLAQAARSYDLAVAHADDSSPYRSELLVLRGSVLLRLGRIADSLDDFERAVALDSRHGPYLWQRGIALYYAGKFEECARQFEAHRGVNPADVENAAWHFACVARSRGTGPARAALLPVGDDARVPMSEIYELFGGRTDRAAVLAAADGAAPQQRASARFYAYLYLGLHAEAEGRRDAAREDITKAVASGIEGFMADVARVHLRLGSKETPR
jgi:lipoprotein NlpI